MHTYEVSGGWQAEDDDLEMVACFGENAEKAERALNAARVRAAEIAARWAQMPESAEEVTAEDRAEMDLAEAEIARGESRRVKIGPR